MTADGNLARIDGFVSLSVVASAIVVALGAPIGDPIIGLLITLVILKITWDSWRTVRAAKPIDLDHVEDAEEHDHNKAGRRGTSGLLCACAGLPNWMVALVATHRLRSMCRTHTCLLFGKSGDNDAADYPPGFIDRQEVSDGY